jgi:hypothetical protein
VVVTGQAGSGGDDGTVAAVLRLADLAGQIERVEGVAARRIDELARDCAAAQEQVGAVGGLVAALAGRADEIEAHLAEVSALLGRMSGQISALVAPAGEGEDDEPGYQVNQPPPWWKPADQRCQDVAGRLSDWVDDVYRPVYGYLADLLAPCWRRHPLCLAYLDVLHEAWCLLYLNRRDPKMVFAQLDWLSRSLLQAAEVMANETRRCRDQSRHCEPGQDAGPFPAAPRLTARR